MYTAVLIIHSWLRWATLALAVAATANAWRTPRDETVSLPGRWWDVVFMLGVDLQVLFGLVLYFGYSPYTQQALTDARAALGVPAVRFWAVQHAGGMLAAVVLVRVGRVMALNARTIVSARRRRLTCFALATLIMIVSVPWPGLPHGRPWLRW